MRCVFLQRRRIAISRWGANCFPRTKETKELFEDPGSYSIRSMGMYIQRMRGLLPDVKNLLVASGEIEFQQCLGLSFQSTVRDGFPVSGGAGGERFK